VSVSADGLDGRVRITEQTWTVLFDLMRRKYLQRLTLARAVHDEQIVDNHNGKTQVPHCLFPTQRARLRWCVA
jgi:hypothetical protein